MRILNKEDQSTGKLKLIVAGITILILMVGVSAWARDPFLRPKQQVSDTSVLRWYSLVHRQADEIETWFKHHPEVLTSTASKNRRTVKKKTEKPLLGADLSGQRIWLRASKPAQQRFAELLSGLDTVRPQILVEARIVRLNREAQSAFGIRWGVHSAEHSAEHVTDRSGLHMNLPQPTSSTQGLAVHVTHLPGNHSLDLELSALESMGMGEIIAMPHLLVSAGHEAVIESGQRIPYQQQTDRHVTAVRFEKAVLSLAVLVTPLPHRKLDLSLTIHQDKPDTVIGNLPPSISTQVVQTHVVVPSGQVIVLGGLYEYRCDQQIQSVPFLGSLPLLGVLFRHRQQQCQRTELLVFLQPQLIDIS